MNIDCCKSYVGKQIIGLLPSEEECLYYLVINSQDFGVSNWIGWSIDGVDVYSSGYNWYTNNAGGQSLIISYVGSQPSSVILDDGFGNSYPFDVRKVTEFGGSCENVCYQAKFDYGYTLYYIDYFQLGGATPTAYATITIDDEVILEGYINALLGTTNVDVTSIWDGSKYVVTINNAYNLGGLTFDDGFGNLTTFDVLPCQITPPTPVPLSLLNAYPGATAGYSVRKLSSSYTGAALRVRRSSDNTEQDIGFSGLDLDTTALTSFVGTGSGFVTKWYDQSGNANDFFINIAFRQPSIINLGTLSIVNLKPAIKFDGINNYLLGTNSINLTGVISIYTVARLTRNYTDYSRLLNGKNDNFVYIGTDTSENIVSGYGNGTSWSQITANSTTTWLNTQRLVSSLNNGTDSQFVNNIAKTPRISAFGSFNNIFMLGGFYISSGIDKYNQMWQGEVQELIIYPNYQISNNNAINTNIMTYYGI